MYAVFPICLYIPSTLHTFGTHYIVNKLQKEGEDEGEGNGKERRERGSKKNIYCCLILLNMKEVELRGRRARSLSIWPPRSKPPSFATY